jgi:hypothetical protein
MKARSLWLPHIFGVWFTVAQTQSVLFSTHPIPGNPAATMISRKLWSYSSPRDEISVSI